MIKYQDIEIEGYYTEGFEATITDPLTLKFSAGKFISGTNQYEYPEFEFDIESDPELDVVYDVYLLAKENSQGLIIRVDRTEMGSDVIPFYDGKTPLVHTLLSIHVLPGIQDLNDMEIPVRNVMRVFPIVEDGDQDEAGS